jgi:uncharacterized protein YfaP (DUF2135 family)
MNIRSGVAMRVRNKCGARRPNTSASRGNLLRPYAWTLGSDAIALCCI